MAGITAYSQEIADALCELIADSKSVREICALSEMPAKSTIFKWLREQPAFSDQYARAREFQAEGFADELIEIADDTSDDVTGEFNMPNSVAVQRAKLRVETRKWVACKLLPKKYGDRLGLKHEGEIGITSILVPDRISTRASTRDVSPDFG
jgi:hypothetical protein